MRTFRSINLSGLLTVLALSTAAIADSPRYAVFNMPGLTNERQWAGAVGINSSGDVVGFTAINEFDIHAVLWPRTGGVVDLGTLGGDDSAAVDISNDGMITGWAAFKPNTSIFVRRACLWIDDEIIDLGTLGGESSYANGMNDLGQVVGESEYEMSNGRQKAFLWDNGEMKVLPAPGIEPHARQAHDVNNLGEIVGSGSTDTGLNALLWRDDEVINLGSLAGDGSDAYAINDLGQIVGTSSSAAERLHAVVWLDEQIRDIHPKNLGGPSSSADDINNNGQIVGWVGNIFGVHRAFIIDPNPPTVSLLDDLMPPRLPLPWSFQRAREINDSEQIVGYGVVPNNLVDTWALLLSPVFPTMELASPTPGIAGEVNTFEVTDARPGSKVFFTYSLHGGGKRIPGCDLQENALQLENPKIVGSAIADANGNASIERFVPKGAAGKIILFQAVVVNDCAISQLVGHKFE